MKLLTPGFLVKVSVIIFTVIGSSYAQTTAVPDPAFEQKLISLGIDTDATINGLVLDSDISSLTTLDISESYSSPGTITDLTGIEGFLSLQNLIASNNQISVIDLSSNVNLLSVNIYRNQVDTLDVSNNINLTDIGCADNLLTFLDVYVDQLIQIF